MYTYNIWVSKVLLTLVYYTSKRHTFMYMIYLTGITQRGVLGNNPRVGGVRVKKNSTLSFSYSHTIWSLCNNII